MLQTKRFAITVLCCMFRPRKVAALNADVSLRAVFGMHVASLLLLALVVLGVVIVEEAGGLRGILTHGFRDAGVSSDAKYVVGAATLASLLAGFLIALALVPWADGDEPVRDTWRHALKTSWFFTPAIAWALAIIAGGSWVTEWLGRLVVEHYYRWEMYIMPPLYGMVFLWVFLVFARAASVKRPTDRPVHHPLCEFCGYVLLHLETHDRCPECGNSIAESLDPTRRRPSKWQTRHYFDWPLLLVSITRAAWIEKDRFFWHLTSTGGRAAAASFLIVQLVLTAAALGSTILVCLMFFELVFPDAGQCYAIFWGAFYLSLVVYVLWAVIVGVVGLVASSKHKRNLVGSACLVGCYTSGCFVPWVAAITVVVFVAVEVVERWGGWWMHDYVAYGFLAANGLFLLCYASAVWRRLAFLRFANRSLPAREAGDGI